MDHILPHYDEALFLLKEEVLELGESLLEGLETAQNVYHLADKKKVNALIAHCENLLLQARDCQMNAAQVLGQFHPMARDLRCVVALSRITDKWEEGVRELEALMRRAKTLMKENYPFYSELVLPLFEMVREELGLSLLALREQDSEVARLVRQKDKVLDARHREAMEWLILAKDSSPQGGQKATLNVPLLFMIRSLERLGDIAKSVAAAVIFLTDARDIRHRKMQEKKQASSSLPKGE